MSEKKQPYSGVKTIVFPSMFGYLSCTINTAGCIIRLTISPTDSTVGESPGELLLLSESHTTGPADQCMDNRFESAFKQIDEYIAGRRTAFDVRICTHGTPFQKAVWNCLSTIPYGETTTYSEIANRLQKPGAARAVGNAVKANPLLILIPCHRVLPKSGGIGDFSAGAAVKQALLDHEKSVIQASPSG